MEVLAEVTVWREGVVTLVSQAGSVLLCRPVAGRDVQSLLTINILTFIDHVAEDPVVAVSLLHLTPSYYRNIFNAEKVAERPIVHLS